MTATLASAEQAWLVCGGCRTMLYGRRFARSGRVCPECGHHAPLTGRQRLASLLDPGSARLLDIAMSDSDPLEFTDSRPYTERLREARERTGMSEAVLCARGRIEGNPVVDAAMDFRFLGGSLG